MNSLLVSYLIITSKMITRIKLYLNVNLDNDEISRKLPNEEKYLQASPRTSTYCTTERVQFTKFLVHHSLIISSLLTNSQLQAIYTYCTSIDSNFGSLWILWHCYQPDDPLRGPKGTCLSVITRFNSVTLLRSEKP